jgi:hypothetical protein
MVSLCNGGIHHGESVGIFRIRHSEAGKFGCIEEKNARRGRTCALGRAIDSKAGKEKNARQSHNTARLPSW